MMEIKVGDLIFTKSLAAAYENEETKATFTFKSPKGKVFALLLIGIEDHKAFGEKEARDRMAELGWEPSK
jgi:hypothetical protein